MMSTEEWVASLFHSYYEELAPEFGYATREESAVPWKDVPIGNKQLMVAVARKVLDDIETLYKV